MKRYVVIKSTFDTFDSWWLVISYNTGRNMGMFSTRHLAYRWRKVLMGRMWELDKKARRRSSKE